MSARVHNVILKGFAAEISQDGRSARLTLEGTEGEITYVLFPAGMATQIAGVILKAVADGIARREKPAAPGKDPPEKVETHVPTDLAIAQSDDAHVLAVRTTDDIELQVLLTPSHRRMLIEALS